LDDSPVLLGSPEDLDRLGLTCTVAKTDARSVEPSGVDAHKRRRVLLVVDTAPAPAEGTAGVELAGKAERAMTAKLEALEPWVYGEAKRQAETSPQEHERELDALPQKRKRKVDAPLQGSPNEGKRGCGHKAPRNSERKPGALPQSERGAPPRRDPEMGALGIWDPGGKPPREGIIEAKGPVEASKSYRGQGRPLTSKTWPHQKFQNQSGLRSRHH